MYSLLLPVRGQLSLGVSPVQRRGLLRRVHVRPARVQARGLYPPGLVSQLLLHDAVPPPVGRLPAYPQRSSAVRARRGHRQRAGAPLVDALLLRLHHAGVAHQNTFRLVPEHVENVVFGPQVGAARVAAEQFRERLALEVAQVQPRARASHVVIDELQRLLFPARRASNLVQRAVELLHDLFLRGQPVHVPLQFTSAPRT